MCKPFTKIRGHIGVALKNKKASTTILLLPSHFYILMLDKTTNEVDRALVAIDYHQYNIKESRSIHPLCVKSRMFEIFSSF